VKNHCASRNTCQCSSQTVDPNNLEGSDDYFGTFTYKLDSPAHTDSSLVYEEECDLGKNTKYNDEEMGCNAECKVVEGWQCSTSQDYRKEMGSCVGDARGPQPSSKRKAVAGASTLDKCTKACDTNSKCHAVEWTQTGSLCHYWEKITNADNELIDFYKGNGDVNEKLTLRNPKVSSGTGAAAALDGDSGTYFETNGGLDEDFEAGIEGGYREVTKVRIKNRANTGGEKLGNAIVNIGTMRCGAIEATPASGAWIEVACAAGVFGDKV